MKTYVKKDLVRMVSQKTGQTHETVAPLVNGVFRVLREIFTKAKPEVRVEIRGFGILGVKKAAAKPRARNPKTNQVIYVPPHRKVFFKPGKLLTQFLHKPLEAKEVPRSEEVRE